MKLDPRDLLSTKWRNTKKQKKGWYYFALLSTCDKIKREYKFTNEDIGHLMPPTRLDSNKSRNKRNEQWEFNAFTRMERIAKDGTWR